MKSQRSAFVLLLVSPASATITLHRKSLNFGPRHSTPLYVVEPRLASLSHSSDPYDVAKSFLSTCNLTEYYIRPDSYMDRNSGVSHIYIRQMIGQLEVANGDINLNIRDGRVLSYGDSFYRGAVSSSSARLTTHGSYCASFAQEGKIMVNDQAQVTLGEQPNFLHEFYIQNCAGPLAAIREVITAKAMPDLHDPRWAALYFMVAAHPDPTLVNYLIRNFDTQADRISVAYEQDFEKGERPPRAMISGLPGALNPVEARLAYFQAPDGNNGTELHIVWRLEVELEDNWYEAYVSALEPKHIISVVDWTSDSYGPRSGISLNALEAKLLTSGLTSESKPGSYKVWRWGINDPQSGNRSIETVRPDKIASPLGWHTISRVNNPAGGPSWLGKPENPRENGTYLSFTSTWGNNVFAQENWKGEDSWRDKYRPDGGPDLNFEYEYCTEGASDCSPKDYINLSLTQLFYTVNMVHDLYYRYGFDEISGNFQQDNYGRGGKDGDAVIAQAQDGGGYNNANFQTPPDGKNGRCRMYLWNLASPHRDGALDAGVLIHELTHGLSNRLTGGPANAACLDSGESGGMGEGWGDFLATTIRSTNGDHGLAMGSWVFDNANGLRRYPYSANMSVNPSTYETLNQLGYIGFHAMGEVWAEILWVVSQRLVEKHGYSQTLFPPQPLHNGTIPTGNFYQHQVKHKSLIPRHGNTLMVQLVIFAMKLQPCRPTFFNARDAIIEADRLLTGGENMCELWAGFSLRGLGIDASVSGGTPWGGGVHTNGFKVPDQCQ
ncbi:unnamed protein product [Rhizoctonia solani]|uniref:Extracellular metalloproteinase n=1 Tax=Rhizoctonia solani TaxID=456999 RepID=A0A8H3DGN0_9AGAM|nr:unnamed protein product [Rhizoctonia solani]